MPNIKRIKDLTDYTSVLPYASEIFGVYQPLIGWKSKRQIERIKKGFADDRRDLLTQLGRHLSPGVTIEFNADCAVTVDGIRPADFMSPRLSAQRLIVLKEISALLQSDSPPTAAEWQTLVNPDMLTGLLKDKVVPEYNRLSIRACQDAHREHEAPGRLEVQHQIRRRIEEEIIVAGTIVKLIENQRAKELNTIFYTNLVAQEQNKEAFLTLLKTDDADPENPYLTFDPKKAVTDVCLSPLGIVHLYRQYFFELDTFLGTPVGHVWLSPGSSVELVEVSTRKVITEKTLETTLERALKLERSTTQQDEFSEAVKEENRKDLKLGITATVQQSWGTGSASATASLNMDRTQQGAREEAHKKMREQSEKLSTEIRENHKSTFKTVTETTDTSSKRYVLANPPDKQLMNYELRRKMRQVAVQVQDIGSYLSWQTFVDEPGLGLGLSSLVHIAQPADLMPVPDPARILPPPNEWIPFKGNAVWNFGDSRQYEFVVVGMADPPPPPPGFELVKTPGVFPMTQISGSGEDFTGAWAFGGRFTPGGAIEIGVITDSSGLEWDERVDFVVGGSLHYRPTAAKLAEIELMNKNNEAAKDKATAENARKIKESFLKGVKDRVELAAGIKSRPFDELREEERIVVYRKLIESLMTTTHYHATGGTSDQTRHVLSELINSIFDIDKMLYFVAPEWWKPRDHAKPFISFQDMQNQYSETLVSWSDGRPRPDNYLITEKSEPAAFGSSLGWLLQLDGDNLRNAFLNAPWVKAVIPIRPGKEEAATMWLQNVNVEGADGLSAKYEAGASAEELAEIRTGLGLPNNAPVTIQDAIRHLCAMVAKKHQESIKVKKYPATEINDDNKVSATPIEKVYEHGFYPLQGGFRVNPNDPNADPNNEDKYFQVFDQWLEILPTDQIVPVPVTYDPKTGRQV
jgi:hypothetical protein